MPTARNGSGPAGSRTSASSVESFRARSGDPVGPSRRSRRRGALETALRGGLKTLSIFFVLHIAILPILGAILAAFHFWLVRKAGGVILPMRPGPEPAPRPVMVPTSPNLVLREMVVALVLIAGVMLTAAVFDAPLLAQANPGMSPNPAKAPWYFMGIQELRIHLRPAFAVLVVPLLAVAFLVLLPYAEYGEAPSGP